MVSSPPRKSGGPGGASTFAKCLQRRAGSAWGERNSGPAGWRLPAGAGGRSRALGPSHPRPRPEASGLGPRPSAKVAAARSAQLW